MIKQINDADTVNWKNVPMNVFGPDWQIHFG